jgi:hypothetical protein
MITDIVDKFAFLSLNYCSLWFLIHVREGVTHVSSQYTLDLAAY